MATVTRFIREDSTAGGNGTTNVGGGADANRAYGSISEWEAAEQTDLVSDGDIHIARIEKAGGTILVTSTTTIAGWTTGASNTLELTVVAGSEHDGTKGTGVIIDLQDNVGFCLTITQDFTTISIIEFINFSTTANTRDGGAISVGTVDEVFLLRCIANTPTVGGSQRPRFFTSTNSNPSENAYFVNCVAAYDSSLGTAGEMFGFFAGRGTHFINSTAEGMAASGSTRGFTTATLLDVVMTNCLAVDCGTDFATPGSPTTTTNASSDATSPQSGLRDLTITFTSPGETDYDYNTSDSDIDDEGTGPSSDTDVPDVDCAGNARSGSTCTIGAFESQAASGVTPEIVPPLAMRAYRFSGRYV